jgi:hypothetical protein
MTSKFDPDAPMTGRPARPAPPAYDPSVERLHSLPLIVAPPKVTPVPWPEPEPEPEPEPRIPKRKRGRRSK